MEERAKDGGGVAERKIKDERTRQTFRCGSRLRKKATGGGLKRKSGTRRLKEMKRMVVIVDSVRTGKRVCVSERERNSLCELTAQKLINSIAERQM